MQVESINKTFLKEGTPKNIDVWVDKSKESSKNKIGIVLGTEPYASTWIIFI